MAPQTVINSLGADVLRLYVASTDYRSEMTISDEILKRSSDSYRRIRNTTRYFLGNLNGFESSQALPYNELLSLDQWALRLTAQVQDEIEQAYENFQFHSIYQRIHQFCVVDMGAFYLDILKDRLYTCDSSSRARLSAQTAMQHILESMVRWITPILSFTAEEIWEHMGSDREPSVLFATRYTGLDDIPTDQAADDFWTTIMSVRDEVSKQIEMVRVAGKIGAGLDASVTLYAEPVLFEQLIKLDDEVRFVLITSAASVLPAAQAPIEAVVTDLPDLKLAILPLEDEKCVRCWQRRPEVGDIAEHPELCQRCVTNIQGDGEIRLHA
jgi:isoleucyl-tRNA synthetase